MTRIMVEKIHKPILLLLSIICLTTSSYNLTQSVQNSRYAAMTHCPGKQIQAWTCKLCPNATLLTNVTYIQNSRTHIVGFAGYQPSTRTIIYAFRCTVDYINYFEDVSFLKVPYQHCKNCQVHLGFFESFRSVENKILSIWYKLNGYDPEAKVLVIGHSLGAAVATFTALELQLKFGNVRELHTYGGPRVGNEYMAAFLKSKLPETYRVVRYKDLPPHLPFQALEYKHQPYEVLFDVDMKSYTVCNSSGQDPNCSNKYFPDYQGKYHWWYFVDLEC